MSFLALALAVDLAPAPARAALALSPRPPPSRSLLPLLPLPPSLSLPLTSLSLAFPRYLPSYSPSHLTGSRSCSLAHHHALSLSLSCSIVVAVVPRNPYHMYICSAITKFDIFSIFKKHGLTYRPCGKVIGTWGKCQHGHPGWNALTYWGRLMMASTLQTTC